MSYMIDPNETPQTTRSRRRLAEALYLQSTQQKPIEHWTQGLAQMAQAAQAGYMLNKEDQADREANQAIANAPGLPGSPAAAQVQPAALDAGIAPTPTQQPQIANVQPGSPPAPATGPRPGGPVMPTNRVWGDAEAEAAGIYEPTTRPANVPSAAAAPPTASPGPTPSAQPANAGPNIPPAVGRYIQGLLANPRTRQQGAALYQQYAKPSEYGFQMTPDGVVLRTDPRAGNVAPIYRSDKTAWGEVGTDANGRPVRGFVDPSRRQVTPYTLPNATDPNSKIPPPPPGVDAAAWNKAHSERATQDAMPADPKTASALRNEVQGLPSYKNIAQAAPVYKSMLDAAGRDNRAADVNLIYGMAKIMDPGSVVRESEMTVAQAVATLPQQLRATVESQLTSTGRLKPEVRQAIMQEARSRMMAYQGMFDQDAGMYRGIAQRGRMNEADVLPSFGPFDEYKPANVPPPRSAPKAAPAGKTRNGLNWSVE